MKVANELEVAKDEVKAKDLCQGTQPSGLHTLAPAATDYSKAVAVGFCSFESILPRP